MDPEFTCKNGKARLSDNFYRHNYSVYQLRLTKCFEVNFPMFSSS